MLLSERPVVADVTHWNLVRLEHQMFAWNVLGMGRAFEVLLMGEVFAV